jgi:hypothetical protein
MTCDQQCLELIRWGVAIVVPALSGLTGVVIGAGLTARREIRQRRHAFRERQLREFYSPMLGLRNEIKMRSELRVKVHDAAGSAWVTLAERAQAVSPEASQRLIDSRGPDFDKAIEYDNTKLEEALLPLYRQMAQLFRENLWLAEVETRAHYQKLIEFIDIWDRWIAKSIPAEVLKSLGHSEKGLHPFYQHLEEKHDQLRAQVQQGEV